MPKNHVVYALDKAYENLAAISLESLLAHTPDLIIHLVVPCSGDYSLIRSICSRWHTVLHIHIIPECFQLELLPQTVQPYFYCIAAINLLKDIQQPVLYMDADTLCLQNIQTIFSLKLSDRWPLAAATHCRPMAERAITLNLSSVYTYYNAGVILFDPSIASSLLSINQFVELFLDEQPRLRFREQCIFNLLVDGKCKTLPNTYNLLSWMRKRNSCHPWHDPAVNLLASDLDWLRDNAIIAHLSAGAIPDHIEHSRLESFDHYWLYVQHCILQGIPAQSYAHYVNTIPSNL